MKPACLRRLEFRSILEMAAEGASTEAGRGRVMSLEPAGDRETSRTLMLETLHASDLIGSSLEPALSSLGTAIETAGSLEDGSIALDPVLLRAAGSFMSDLIDFIGRADAAREEIPGVLHDLLGGVSLSRELSRHLLAITTPDGELSPSASPLLRKLARRMDSLRSSLSSRISSICADYASRGILRDAPPTMRSGRFVIPVAASRKGSVRGIIHDRSDSGATVFMEPAQLVEAGNELQEAAMDYEQERRRILREATSMLRERSGEFTDALETAVELDSIFARARYHRRWKTVFPEEGPVNLKGLVHPLLPPETAVRSDVSLPGSWRVLVVSGPNAGGKSVLLKAVALASLCSRCGLGVHASGGSTMPFFSRVMVSMGDNQSISMHLSTYSARLSEQKMILDQGDRETLAIIDEPAAGTDPVTGAALAAVFLERMADSGTRAIVSTHMGQLKLLAMEKEGFLNGSMSFDPETLTPGYSFIPDLPGASCTLEAAAIAGFPAEITGRASELAGDSFSLDSLVASLRDLEERRSGELLLLERERKELQEKARTLRRNLREAERKAGEMELEAERERNRLLREIESKADSLLATISDTSNRDQRLRARRELGEMARNLSADQADNPETADDGSLPDLSVGDSVKVEGWPQPGRVEKVSRSTVMVRLGSMLLKKEKCHLEKVSAPEPADASASEYSTPEERPEAMLIGLTVDEAVAELDIKMDNCVAAGLRRLRVVHGKGRLMKGVTDWLRGDRRVRSVSMAPPEEGGAGASIVLLRG